MNTQFSFFSEADDCPGDSADPKAAATGSSALRLTVGKDARLSPAQLRFNRLLARIEKVKEQMADLETLADAYRPQYSATLTSLEDKKQALMRSMIHKLDECIQGTGLTAVQKRIGAEILCDLTEALAALGDETMQVLHDKYSARSLRDKEQDSIADMRDVMEQMLGQPLKSDEPLDSFDAMMNAMAQHFKETTGDDQTQRKATGASKKPTVAQKKAAQQQEDAETVLRKVFRQLVSSLHPDRERDPAEKQRKTTLMSEANVAYGRQDLVALLQIQMRVEQSGVQSFAQLAEEKIEAMTLLLKQQAAELERGLHQRKHQLLEEFDLSWSDVFSAAGLRTRLLAQERVLQRELSVMQQDLLQVQEAAGLKQWLKRQQQLMREDEKDRARRFF
ncbi:MAG: hypothetical protein Q8O29_14720 [Polaromonas sp.]|uniref:hypothetical protein n=1 Tax=Polaromonas sp. TaxID=1869339 RepID=UPI0027360E6A|nr:hypothetical protein [Polaromonas sp.]MDP2819489.1 hypothetical protein [Polaromonas sp.]